VVVKPLKRQQLRSIGCRGRAKVTESSSANQIILLKTRTQCRPATAYFSNSIAIDKLFERMPQNDSLVAIRAGRNHIYRHAAYFGDALQIIARSLW